VSRIYKPVIAPSSGLSLEHCDSDIGREKDLILLLPLLIQDMSSRVPQTGYETGCAMAGRRALGRQLRTRTCGSVSLENSNDGRTGYEDQVLSDSTGVE
jgi:hypothetical protein